MYCFFCARGHDCGSQCPCTTRACPQLLCMFVAFFGHLIAHIVRAFAVFWTAAGPIVMPALVSRGSGTAAALHMTQPLAPTAETVHGDRQPGHEHGHVHDNRRRSFCRRPGDVRQREEPVRARSSSRRRSAAGLLSRPASSCAETSVSECKQCQSGLWQWALPHRLSLGYFGQSFLC